MPIKRVFLNWDGPCLERSADYLISLRPPGSGKLDFRGITVVLPGARAERRLMEILVGRAEALDTVLIPPERRTVGGLPELFYSPRLPFAETLQRRLAWIDAIRSTDKKHLRAVMPAGWQDSTFTELLALAKTLEALWIELSSACLHFRDVAKKGETALEFLDQSRWNALEEIHANYIRILEAAGYTDRHWERLHTLSNKACYFCGELILISTADLRLLACDMLRQSDADIIALIHAPESIEDCFDDMGCLKVKSWVSRQVPLQDSQISIAYDPGEQAAQVSEAIARGPAPLSPEDITIGVVDDELVPYLSMRLEADAVPVRPAKGIPLPQTQPATLLSLVAAYLRGYHFRDFASLVRHPDIQNWYAHQGTPELSLTCCLSALDQYHAWHLPRRLDEALFSDTPSGDELRGLKHALDSLLAPLAGPPRALTLWLEPTLDLLKNIYSNSSEQGHNSSDQQTISACERIADLLQEIKSLPTQADGEVSANEALSLALQCLSEENVPPEPDPQAVELLGWLELPLDDAPVLVIVGMNEGRVPQSLNADTFLPNSLRNALGLLDNERRYARDCYALNAIIHSRAQVTLIAGRRSASGDPLLPSRLFAACNPEVIAKRMCRFYEQQTPRNSIPLIQPSKKQGAVLTGEPPRPETCPEPTTSMSVTSFRDYLRCPYRFYLKHVLRLQTLDDSASEMDASLFGALAHQILKLLGEQEIASPSKDEQSIKTRLDLLLDREVKRRFGRAPLPSVLIQVEQLRARLSDFSRWQSARYAQGWRIKHVELVISESEAWLDLPDGRRTGLRGAIDRVDYHQEDKLWAIFDYKTSDQARKPGQVHRSRNGQWTDLQLPLYAHLFKARSISANPLLGYINLAKDREVHEAVASWTDEDLESAHAAMCEVAGNVMDGVFWPPSSKTWAFDEFADICGVGLLSERTPAQEDE